MSFIQEAIFTHAAALHQSGQMKNTIYASGHTVFVLNMDNTVMLRFLVSERELGIDGEVSFASNDYDSEHFKEENGRVVFIQRGKGIVREKSCRAPDMNFNDVEELWGRYVEADRKAHHNQKVSLTNEVIPFLDTALSHLEIKSENKKVFITQRDIYTGSIITIRFDSADTGLGIDVSSNIDEDFGPIGIRTDDFIALFSFNEKVSFYFHPTSPFMLIQAEKLSMSGALAGCVYDEMGETTVAVEETDDGWKEQKDRRSEQKADSAPDETTGEDGSETPVRRRRKRKTKEEKGNGQCGAGLLNI